MNNKCDGCKFYCNGRCFGEKDAPYVEYADCKGENNRPDIISNERAKEVIAYLKSIRTLFEHGKSRTAENALKMHENYIKALDDAIEIVNKYYYSR